MRPNSVNEVPDWVLKVLNNIYDIERKIKIHGDVGNIKRNIEKIKENFENEKIFYDDPMGGLFVETRTDLDVSIAGEGVENLYVVEVIKPIVRIGNKDYSRVIQKGIVVVETKKKDEA